MSQKREIECLARLNDLNGAVDDVLQFLLSEKLVTKEEIKFIQHSSDQPKNLQATLKKLSSTDKLQLVEYEWTILPVERIKIHIVTDRATREFTYNF